MEYLKRWVIELFLLYIFSDGSVATVTQWRHQYKMWSESYANGCLSGWNFLPGTQETGKSNWHCWTDKVAKTSRKTKKQFRPIEKIWEEAGQDMALNFFFGFSMVLEQFFSSFRIWIVCMRVWDRSKLQEWKQISRQDDFKQTVQDMRVCIMCTPSPPSSSYNIYIYVALYSFRSLKLHLPPNFSSDHPGYNATISACGKGHEWQLALMLVSRYGSSCTTVRFLRILRGFLVKLARVDKAPGSQ